MTAKILVVDDEPDLELLIRQRFRRQIRDRIFEFQFAQNGVDALKKLQLDGDIELVLTDINMPEMDGLTLLVKLGELNLLLKAVIVSAYGDLDNIRTAMNRGAFDFLTKPIDFQDLEITIQKTLKLMDELKRAVREHDQLLSIHQELEVARDMQQSILPQHFPPFPDHPELDIHARMIAAKEVGGDFYDFFLIDSERIGFVIADVSGKGVPAALFMMVSRTLTKSHALQGLAADRCLHVVNNRLCADNPMEMFVTLFYGILNLKTGILEYSNGGHNPPYILRKSGVVEFLPKCGGMALGMFSDSPYKAGNLTLEPGDGLFLYTDGVTEAEATENQFFTDARLKSVLDGLSGATAETITRTVMESVKIFAGDAPQSDDITTLALRYRGL